MTAAARWSSLLDLARELDTTSEVRLACHLAKSRGLTPANAARLETYAASLGTPPAKPLTPLVLSAIQAEFEHLVRDLCGGTPA